MPSGIIEKLFFIPQLTYKVQFFELIFVGVLFFYRREILEVFKSDFALKKELIGFGFLITLNTILFFDKNVLLQNLGSWYSCLIPVVFFAMARKIDLGEKAINKGLVWTSIILPITCLLGYCIYKLGVSDQFVLPYPDYPYFGEVVRWRGFMNAPNNVVFVGAICLFFLFFHPMKMARTKKIFLLMSLVITLAFTLSKEVIIIPMTMLTAFLFQAKQKFLALGSIVFSIFLIVATTFFVLSKKEINTSKLYLNKDKISFEIGDLKAYPTTYYYLWNSSIQMIKEYPILGNGFGNFEKKIDQQKKTGTFPAALPSLKAHDNYSGLVAQYGIGYLIFLVFFVFALQKLIREKIQKPYQMFVLTSLIFILYFGFTYTSFHLRFMWMFFGIVIFYAAQNDFKKISQAQI